MTKLLTICFFLSISCFAKSNLNTYSTSLEYAHVTKVKATKSANGTWCFYVSVRHHDTGWNDYADAWKIADMSGKIFVTRILAHPHVDEQPFTRSMCGIVIPKNISKVMVSAKTNKDGYKGRSYIYHLKK